MKTLWNRPLVLLALLALVAFAAGACGITIAQTVPPTPQVATAPTTNGNGVNGNDPGDAVARSTLPNVVKWNAKAFNMYGNSSFTLTLSITLGEKGENTHGKLYWPGLSVSPFLRGLNEVRGTYRDGKLSLYIPGTVIYLEAEVAGDEMHGGIWGGLFSKIDATKIR